MAIPDYQTFEGIKESTYMIFIFGIILFVIGSALSLITAEETRYPFQPIGVLMVLIGIVLVVVSVYQTFKRGSRAQPARKFCRYCGGENKSDAIFCEKCGKKIAEQG